MSYWGGGPTSIVAGLLALTALGTAPHGRAAVKRPAVAVTLSIEAEQYRRRLNDMKCERACLQLQTRLADSVKAVLKRTYPFLDWAGESAQDTVVMRWIHAPPVDVPVTRLDFRIAGPVPRMRQPSFPVDLESFTEMNSRLPARWNQDSLLKEWVGRLATRLVEPEILVTVFGRIPIVATAKFPKKGFAEVLVLPQEIGAAPRSRPVFALETTITDPGLNTRDTAELLLHKCKTNGDNTGFVCEISSANYESDRVRGPQLLDLLGRATIAVGSVHVIEFVSDGQTSRYAGNFPTGAMP